MGYTTEFIGSFVISPTLTPAHREYLTAFAQTRRMKRDPLVVVGLPDPLRIDADLPIGIEGGFYIGDTRDHFLNENAIGVIDQNEPPKGQPGLWCQWIPSEDGLELAWDEGEKFYEYTTWLKYLIDQFLTPWGYALTGTVEWSGEESDDRGMLIVEGNDKVRVRYMLADPYGEASDA